MKEKITVDKAIKRGHLIINVPVWFLMMGIPGLAIYLFSQKIIPNWGIAVGFLVGFLFAWLYWSYGINKWRIWAFDKVRNVHELKKKAIQQGLIWKDDSWFNKTEIKSDSDKRKWNLLKKKFEKKDIFKEDYQVPKKSIIYYSKIKNTYEFILMLVCLIGGVFLLINSDSYIMGSLLTITGGYFGFKELKQVLDTNPQITVDSKGIKTINTEFKKWREIKNEEVLMEGSGKHREFYLIYDYNNGFEKLNINDYNVDPKELENLIRTYRIRNNKSYR